MQLKEDDNGNMYQFKDLFWDINDEYKIYNIQIENIELGNERFRFFTND